MPWWMRSGLKKSLIGLCLLSALFVVPRSLADDLFGLSPSASEVTLSEISPTPNAIPEVSGSPSAEPLLTSPPPSIAASPTPSVSTSDLAVTPPESKTVTAPPPAPPHALSDQNMQIAVPSSVATDPRAHYAILPRISVSRVDTLLICGYSSSSAVQFSSSFPGVETSGNGSPFFRISGPTNLAIATLNGDIGARIISSSKALPGSTITLAFISLSKPSISPSFCNDGNPSNNRTISIRALNLDLNMVKDDVRLK